jgi:N-methylhydantoinase B
LLEIELPMNQGAIKPLAIRLPDGSLLNPRRPYAVAAGNVETSQRIVDVVFGALARALPDLVPAASQGTMNNFTFGSLHLAAGMETASKASSDLQNTPFAYYETIGGGVGAGPAAAGGHGMHVHMSNTRNTPVEALEYGYPLRVTEYRLRQGSGGAGTHMGGDGLIRTIQFLAPARVTIVSERRELPPYGLNGGRPGAPGRNTLLQDGRHTQLPGKITLDLKPGDAVRLETPGGGGWGQGV